MDILVIVSTPMVILIFMYLRVAQKGVSSCKWFVTLVTFIWPKTCVTAQVNIQMAWLRKKFLAVNALIWSLPFSSLIVEKYLTSIWYYQIDISPRRKRTWYQDESSRDAFLKWLKQKICDIRHIQQIRWTNW